jgi:hypothetical protein
MFRLGQRASADNRFDTLSAGMAVLNEQDTIAACPELFEVARQAVASAKAEDLSAPGGLDSKTFLRWILIDTFIPPAYIFLKKKEN